METALLVMSLLFAVIFAATLVFFYVIHKQVLSTLDRVTHMMRPETWQSYVTREDEGEDQIEEPSPYVDLDDITADELRDKPIRYDIG